ncbi:unnamed protein product [Clonostachys byssicola]|uniref:Uncharacterized protein n=1 Tax=Clonostachys byssicola TaxID=160290 RepID=A0A9N9UFL5_9HYPO|nr:unnamed protein product [Clonostachys byssicola]
MAGNSQDEGPPVLAGSQHHSSTQNVPQKTGESSATRAARTSMSPAGQDQQASGADHAPFDRTSTVPDAKQLGDESARDTQSRRRAKPRSGGGFLLQNAALGEKEPSSRRRSRLIQQKGKGVSRTPERQKPNNPPLPSARSSGESPRGQDRLSASLDDMDGYPRADVDSDHKRYSSEQYQSGPDVDATQIVSMALNLSESRRVASRKSAPRTSPPRLNPLPESSSKTNLRQHFQQQRKVTRPGSPKPPQAHSTRIPSSHKFGFEDGQEANFRFHFSASTIARARKAKEHLELMAEYRRLLEHLPPLTSGRSYNNATPPESPFLNQISPRLGSDGVVSAHSRPYNPLQYVRNRKVRARERKVIDGEQQGFTDVDRVRKWVDKISEQQSLAGSRNSGSDSPTIPPFNEPDENDDSNAGETVTKTVSRVRRPRVDWFFDPCDIIADAYWLEQDHHKHLIEDRLWRKILPAPGELSRPTTNQPMDFLSTTTTPLDSDQADRTAVADFQDFHLPSKGLAIAQGGSKDRAKAKVNEIRGFHHRRAQSHAPHDFLRKRHSYSSSDSSSLYSAFSDNESDKRLERRRKKGLPRRETLTTDPSDLLQKQMTEMVAQETRDGVLPQLSENDLITQIRNSHAASDQKQLSKPVSRSHSRGPSVADFSDSEPKDKSPWGTVTRQQHGRPSLEVPGRNRSSSTAVNISSIPNSPQLSPAREYGESPFTWDVEISRPSSRSQSPSRNPLSKVKRKIFDKSRGHLESQSEAEEEGEPHVIVYPDGLLSPTRTIGGKSNEDAWKAHKRSTSVRSRAEEGFGLRSILAAPRIDTVIRGSVSKIGDLIWRKDEGSDSSSDSSDESDSDVAKDATRPIMSRGRSAQSSDEVPPNVKNFYDEMPLFQHVSEINAQAENRNDKQSMFDKTKSTDSSTSRWNLLKPPRIDIQSASPGSPSPIQEASHSEESDYSTSKSPIESDQRDRDHLNADSSPDVTGRPIARHWSITDNSLTPESAQLSRREVARMRALILSAGIKAMEITRRAGEIHRPLANGGVDMVKTDPISNVGSVNWSDIARLAPNSKELQQQEVVGCEVYPLASRALGMAMQVSGQRWQSSADRFTNKTVPNLQKQLWQIRSRLTDDLSQLTRQIADEADETTQNLALDQPLKVKHVVDVMDKLLRKRRRRFRWVRRGLWLAVEWVLVGFMWYVWFVVTVLRVFFGIGRGVGRGIRWLLCL